MNKAFKLFAALLGCCLSLQTVHAETINLNMPNTGINFTFYQELLETALTDAGHEARVTGSTTPHNRAINQLEQSEVDIYNLVESAERNDRFTRIDVGLTNGLIAHRVLMTPIGGAAIYAKVQTLEDFRALDKVVGLGQRWFGVKVWKLNGLKAYEHSGLSKNLFPMLAAGNRGFDYYSTSAIEVGEELEKFAHLGIELEPRLVLIYDRDYVFYMSPEAGKKYGPLVEAALKGAKESGLIDKLVQKHWGELLEEIGFDKRIKIHLQTPP